MRFYILQLPFKGTVNVISNEPPDTDMAHAWLKTVPNKPLFDQECGGYFQVLNSDNFFMFSYSRNAQVNVVKKLKIISFQNYKN